MRIIFSIITIDLALFIIVASAVSKSLEGRSWKRDFPWKYMCPEAPPPPGSYPPGKSAHAFIDLFHWCRSTDGGPACTCNQITGLPECGGDGPNRGMSFDFDSMTAAYPCLNCLCVDMRKPGLHRLISGNTFPLGTEEQLGKFPKEAEAPSTNEEIPQPHEKRVSGHGQGVGPSREVHSSEDVQAPRFGIHGGTRGITITTGTRELYEEPVSGPPKVTTAVENVNRLLTVGMHATNGKLTPENAHRLKGFLSRAKSVQSSPGAGPSNPSTSSRFNTIKPAQRPSIHIIGMPAQHEKTAESPAAGPADGLPKWGAKAHRTAKQSVQVGLSRIQLETLSRANPHQRIDDDELGNMYRVRMSGRPIRQSANRFRVPARYGGGGSLSVADSSSSRTGSSGNMDMD